jgi:staphylococcal nuclease domain-containing protein 1
LKLTSHSGVRAPRNARNASEKSEPYGLEAAEFSTHRFLQRDIEFEVDAVDKSGGFIGALYLNKTENAAVVLAKEGLVTVHSSSADGLSWVRQLYDAEVSSQFHRHTVHEPSSRQKPKQRSAMYVLLESSIRALRNYD